MLILRNNSRSLEFGSIYLDIHVMLLCVWLKVGRLDRSHVWGHIRIDFIFNTWVSLGISLDHIFFILAGFVDL
jgi:hypothetical protein